ncbi:MAG: trypsin-like serine protease, partial [Gammaproteobacteria bacterium]
PAKLRVYLQNGGIYPVAKVDVNPSFNFGVGSDVAVLTLSDPVSGIPPAAINTTASPTYDSPGRIVGFGISDIDLGDYGIKRYGSILTSSCAEGGIPEPQNICWRFAEPVGAPGEDSNICNGDSGAPLFIDTGTGEAVAGVASGLVGDCRAGNLSFATNVYENRSFIRFAMGASRLDAMGVCRSDVRNYLKKYTAGVYNAEKQCVDLSLAGKTTLGECIANKANSKKAKAAAAISLNKLAKVCPDSVIKKSELGGVCAWPVATPGELRACIIDAGDTAAARMLEVEYADAESASAITGNRFLPVTDKALLKCQKAVGSASKSYAFKSLAASNQCEAKIDKGKVAEADCPLPATQNSTRKFATSLEKKILQACPDAVVATLRGIDPFGASCATAASASDLAGCVKSEHASVVNDLVELAPGKTSTFNAKSCGMISQVGDAATISVNRERSDGVDIGSNSVLHTLTVPAGINLLRVTLNGDDRSTPTGYNDIDLYLRYQNTPIPDPTFQHPIADAYSFNGGVFEAVEVKTPAAGEWRILIQDIGTLNGKPYQLSVTMFR